MVANKLKYKKGREKGGASGWKEAERIHRLRGPFLMDTGGKK